MGPAHGVAHPPQPQQWKRERNRRAASTRPARPQHQLGDLQRRQGHQVRLAQVDPELVEPTEADGPRERNHSERAGYGERVNERAAPCAHADADTHLHRAHAILAARVEG